MKEAGSIKAKDRAWRIFGYGVVVLLSPVMLIYVFCVACAVATTARSWEEFKTVFKNVMESGF